MSHGGPLSLFFLCVIFWFFALDEEGLHLSKPDKSSTVSCPYGGCVSHLQICDFNTDCPADKDESICGEYELYLLHAVWLGFLVCQVNFMRILILPAPP